MIGIIIFAYGAPNSISDLPAYYTNIHNGRKLSENEMKIIEQKYAKIGLADTLGSITIRQARALEEVVNFKLKEKVKVYMACKHSPPFVEDVIKNMYHDGVSRLVTFPIKPLYSKSGFAYYQALVRKALKDLEFDIPVINIEKWHLHPEIISILADRVKTAWTWLPKKELDKSILLYTSHSIPGTKEVHESFRKQFKELATAISTKTGVQSWDLAYRSAGVHEGLWLEPDIKQVLREKKEKGYRNVLVCELLTLTSNLEVYFDLGYDLEDTIKDLGITYYRTAMLDDSYDFILALSKILIDHLENSLFCKFK